MVKKWIVMIGIILAIVGVCIWENLYIQKAFSFLEGRLNEIEVKLSQNEEAINTQENIKEIKKLHEEWQHYSNVLKTIVWHTGMKDVEINLSRILSYVEENDYTEAMVELHVLEDFCKHYSKDFTINIQNILAKTYNLKSNICKKIVAKSMLNV